MSTIDLYLVLAQSLGLPRLARPQDTIMEAPVHGADYCWMPDRGVQPIGKNIGALVPLAEPPDRQTLCSPFLSALQRTLYQHLGRYQHMAMALAVVGGSSLAYRNRGSATWIEMQRIITRMRDLAAERGDTVVLRGVLVLSGETESYTAGHTAIEFRDGLLEQCRRVNDEARMILGQTEDVLYFPYQTGREPSDTFGSVILQHQINDLVLSPLMAEQIDPRIVCAGPSYPDPYEVGDNTHICAQGIQQQAERFADIVAHTVYGTYRRRSLQIRYARMVSDTILRVTYWRPISLAATDETLDIARLGPGLGYEAVLEPGGAPMSISSVALTTGDDSSIDITFSTAPTRSFHLLYASPQPTPVVDQEYSNCFGAVRDAGPFVLTADSGSGRDEYHWASPQQLLIHR